MRAEGALGARHAGGGRHSAASDPGRALPHAEPPLCWPQRSHGRDHGDLLQVLSCSHATAGSVLQGQTWEFLVPHISGHPGPQFLSTHPSCHPHPGSLSLSAEARSGKASPHGRTLSANSLCLVPVRWCTENLREQDVIKLPMCQCGMEQLQTLQTLIRCLCSSHTAQQRLSSCCHPPAHSGTDAHRSQSGVKRLQSLPSAEVAVINHPV